MIILDQLEGDDVEIFKIEDDKAVEYELPISMGKKTKDNWLPLFDPKAWWRLQEKLKLENLKLSNR